MCIRDRLNLLRGNFIANGDIFPGGDGLFRNLCAGRDVFPADNHVVIWMKANGFADFHGLESFLKRK